MLGTLIDWLAFSGLWVAAVAGALCVATSTALGAPVSVPVVGVAMAGTLVVYSIDRLRDLDRDRVTSPDRSAFVARNATALPVIAMLGAVASAGFALRLGIGAALLLAPVLLLGLLHRRVKHLPYLKSAYLTAAWITVVVGLPAQVAGVPEEATWPAGILALAIFANAIAFNVRDREAAVARFGRRPALWTARGFAAAGVVMGAMAPHWARPLAAIPTATLLALLPFRSGERYSAIAVDGALLAGACVAVVVIRSA